MKLVMKNSWAGAVLLLYLLIAPAGAWAAFGPDEWLEYRLNDSNNPVFNQEGVKPLEATTFETEDEIRSTPVVAGDRMFVGNHNTGGMFAFDIKTGEQLWQNQAPNWIHSEMIYHDGTVYVGYGNRFFQGNGLRGTGKSGVMAVDAETGETKWQTSTDGEVMPAPVYHDGYVYAAAGDRQIYKMEVESGEVVDEIGLGHVVSMSSPNLYEGKLFVGGGHPQPYTFSSIDLADGEVVWQTEMPKAFAGLDDVPPAISDDIVVTTALEGPKQLTLKEVYEQYGLLEAYKEMGRSFGGERMEHPEHVIYAMDTETGEVLWKKSLGYGEMVKNNKSGAPMIYNGTVYVGSPITKKFYAYDLKTGERLWDFQNTTMKAPPVAEGGVVYFSNAKGYVHALDAETGEEIGRKKLGGTLAPSGPIIMNDTLIVGSQDSKVYALPTEDIRNGSDAFTADPEPPEKSQFSFLTVVYGIPLVTFVVLVTILIVTVRKSRKNKIER
ncbi:PQQ-binding-like beta-propeller repeat protein [Thalassobacillus devorans]|uniref:outer membrane protein assembly factor BamB family protein n=1 Tax=Thalassobacillus devorans TaxID=279813 RepID=UPI0004ADF20A|nr:PQQ-binding-like beta-propeller repeat protein [Thalassobacillus devorans]